LKEQRERWGCDGPAVLSGGALGAFKLECWGCVEADPDCPKCHGTGFVWFQRCPSHYWEPWVGELLQSYRDYDERGLLPSAGSMEDQSHLWRKACRMIRLADRLHRQRAERDARKRAKREVGG